MKRMLTLAMLIVPCFFIVQGQAFTGGIAGGITGNQIDGDSYYGYHKMGFTAGGYVQTRLEGNWQFQMEIAYIMKGAANAPSPDNSSFYKVRLQYVEVPVLANWYIGKKIFPEAGISFGYLFDARQDLTGTGYGPADFKKTEFSVKTGINYQFTDHIRGNLRLSYSIFPVRNHPGDQTYLLNRGEYNNTLGFGVYYRLK